MKTFVTLAASAAALLALCSPALAHIVLQVKEAQVGAAYRAVLVVGHGCGEEATTGLRVQVPDGFFNVKPLPKAGWDIATVTGPYETPFLNHGTEIAEGVKEITWSGGSLPNDFFDEFTFRGTFGTELEEGSTFYFPVIQTCGTLEDAWIDQSGDDDVEFPAPSVTLSPAVGHAH
ncbi:MAG TPA: YcnI family protein [Devosia sp.]|nr:YcnI family protein [Devosia sp.]